MKTEQSSGNLRQPTVKQVETVIKTLKQAQLMVRKETGNNSCPVDMCEDKIHPCGTPMCHGGYYSLVKGLKDFNKGAKMIAYDLGFDGIEELTTWAFSNPELWGNSNGIFMFVSSSAFVKSGTVKDLQTIISHWQGVKERIRKSNFINELTS